MSRVAGRDIAAPVIASLPPPAKSTESADSRGLSFSASRADACDLHKAAWQACLSGMDALQKEFDAHPARLGTGKALRARFERCKALVQRAGAALLAVTRPTATPPGYSRETGGTEPCSPELRAWLALTRARLEVEGLAKDAKAAARLYAPRRLFAKVGILAAGIAIALAGVAVTMLFPAALPAVACSLMVAFGGGMAFSSAICAFFQVKREDAAFAMCFLGGKALAQLNDIVGQAERHAIARENKAAKLLQKTWRRHVGHVDALRQQAPSSGDDAKFVTTHHAGPGGARTYVHYRDRRDAQKERMPPTLALWGPGHQGPELGEGGYNRVQRGPMGLVIREETQSVAAFQGAPIGRFADLDSFVGAVRISRTISVARFAGTPLDRILSRGDKVPLSYFKQASMDLKTAHRRKMFHRDIKPSNMTLKDKRVHFIDCDSMIDMQSCIRPQACFFTPRYASVDATKGDAELGLKTADEFAFLISMIETTIDCPDEVTDWLEKRAVWRQDPGWAPHLDLPPPRVVDEWLEKNTTMAPMLKNLVRNVPSYLLAPNLHLHDLMKWPEEA